MSLKNMIGLSRKQYARRLGTYLKRERESRRISQSRAAVRVGVHRNTLLRWERGESLPDVHQLMLLQKMLREDAGEPIAQEESL